VRDTPTQAAPLVLQLSLHVQGSRNGVLRDGDTVASRDRIQVSVLTSEDAYLYLAYCSKDRKLDVFPVQGSIRTRAGKRAFAPDRAAAIVLDDNRGPEALYVIVSRSEIASTGQRFIKAAAASGPNEVATDCGTRARGKTLDAGLERGGEVIWNGVPAVSADAGGIVVLRYGLKHVAAAAPLR